MRGIFIFIVLLFNCAITVTGQVQTRAIETGWVFSESGKSQWLEAKVPGYVHLDLYRNGIIPNPVTGTGESACQWVETKDWVYQGFPFDAGDIINEKMITMRFEGLDTYARVFLNDSLVITANNAFVPWQCEVNGILKPKGNVIRIEFQSPVNRADALVAASPHPLPGDAKRAVVRKPQYQFGWDWGPRLVSCGITGPITLTGYSSCDISHCHLLQNTIDSLEAGLTMQVEIHSLPVPSAELTVVCRETNQRVQKKCALKKGNNVIKIPLTIAHPTLWWSRGEGEQHLYHFDVTLAANGVTQDEDSLTTGLRTIRLLQEVDSLGTSFQFELNGKKIFAKGANYIPVSPFPSADDTVEQNWLIRSCVAANMNMIRVWGGGIYERDSFYDLCDREGLLVWQDFMYACAMYPGDAQFLASAKSEADWQVKRLRHHPCIALWCGNNEISEGWHRWGWQDGLDKRAKHLVWKSYDDLFGKLLRNSVQTFTDVPYHESSPTFGRGDNRYLLQGDAHDWWVWHDAKPFEHFQHNVPRFMSEFGFQSMPSYEVLAIMTDDGVVNRASPGWNLHQKHGRGFELIDTYMQRQFPPLSPDSIEQYSYLSQLVQASGMAGGMLAQRNAKGKCAGTLYWQLNDTWPSFSWSSIDYNGEWKALHYFAARSFAPLALGNRGDTVFVCSEGVSGEIVHDVWRCDMRKPEMTRAEMNSGPDDAGHYILHKVSNGTHSAEVRIFHPSVMWNTLPEPEIKTEVSDYSAMGYPIEISTDVFARFVKLSADVAGYFSDNYFDLDAGQTRTVYFIPRYGDAILPVITVTSLHDAWH
ncbi:MAG: glycoside hydrolase family 2 protein [Flavobacteriales bacterium]|nr:glycoside hydrolase family 2 protein [Flavobacteriales bacterium]